MDALKALALAGLLAVSGSAFSEHYHHKQPGMGMAMKHANPMPNLMQMIKRHGSELDLTEKQSKALAEWRDTHHEPLHALAQQVNEMEQAIHKASLAGKRKAKLMKMLDEVFEVRRKIASVKTDCRDNMKKILTGEQYDKVVKLYREAHQ